MCIRINILYLPLKICEDFLSFIVMSGEDLFLFEEDRILFNRNSLSIK